MPKFKYKSVYKLFVALALPIVMTIFLNSAPVYAGTSLDQNPDPASTAPASSGTTTSAGTDGTCADGSGEYADSSGNCVCPSGEDQTTDSSGNDFCQDAALSCTSNCDFIKDYVNPGIDLLSAIAGVIFVISLIVGGIQFSSSSGDPQKIAQARRRIANTIIAIFAFLFLYAFLQFLVPGGIFNK